MTVSNVDTSVNMLCELPSLAYQLTCYLTVTKFDISVNMLCYVTVTMFDTSVNLLHMTVTKFGLSVNIMLQLPSLMH